MLCTEIWKILIKGINLRSNGFLEFPHKLNPIKEVASINEFHHEEKSVLEEVGKKGISSSSSRRGRRVIAMISFFSLVS